MEAPLYYLVRVKLIRFIKDDEIDYISEEREYKDENPIVARERALNYYNSYIDTLLEKNLSHNEIRALLTERLVDENISVHFDTGIGVFMIATQPLEEDNKIKYKGGEEYLIHGVGFGIDAVLILDNLTSEIEYYSQYGYDTRDNEISIRFYYDDEDEIRDEVILKTPYDWTGLDITDYGDNKEKKEINGGSGRSLTSQELSKSLIMMGEGKLTEFKPSLLSYKKGKEVFFGKYNKFEIIRTIAAFLNSSGGFLLVGVGDKRDIIGLENDFSLAGDKSDEPKDYFNIQVDYIIKENFKSIASNINGEFVEIEGRDIYLFRIKPSPIPIFVSNNTESTTNPQKEFYVRTTGASSIHYYDIEDIVGYCMNHWNKI